MESTSFYMLCDFLFFDFESREKLNKIQKAHYKPGAKDKVISENTYNIFAFLKQSLNQAHCVNMMTFF